MADNVATALKNLNKELTEADVKIRAAQGDSQALFDAIVRGVGISKDAFRSLVSELSGTNIKGARTIDIVTRLVDENGKKLTPASIKSTIENITKDNKPQTLGLFQYKTSDLNTLQQMLAMSKKDAADLLSTVLKISNASVGLNKAQGTAYSNALASRIKEEARARNKIIKLQERQLQLEQAIDRASSNKSGKTKFEGQMRSVADLNKELAKTARLISQQNAILQGSGRGQNVAKALGLGTAKKEADMLNNSLSKTIGLAQRLGYAFGIAFSAQGLVQFGKKLVETRGEFEMQFVAMKQIIGDVDQATKIWNQTMQQALQSPFKAMQLTDYTKKLAAYRIETEKLFDTTKRLADVSAGLGVDMGRLILAYGQVKAANFLRASEIRQFTEAGVNIVGQLSQYFTELENRTVSTADVMERVTKRMVMFEDVEAIFKRMTDEGGEFYNMQEVQSQTVRGQIMKLHDAYDQMLNSIGESKQGVIKGMTDALLSMVRNWKDVALQIQASALALGVLLVKAKLIPVIVKSFNASGASVVLFNRKLRAANITLDDYIARQALAARGATGLGKGIRYAAIAGANLEKVFRMVPKGLWFMAVIELVTHLVLKMTEAKREARRLSNELDRIGNENATSLQKNIDGFKDLVERLKQATEGSQNYLDIRNKIQSQYGEYLDSLEAEQITVENLASSYDRVVERMREKSRQHIMEEGLQEITNKYGDAYLKFTKSLEGVTVGNIKLTGGDAENIAKKMYDLYNKRPSGYDANSLFLKALKEYGLKGAISNSEYSDRKDFFDVIELRYKKQIELERKANSLTKSNTDTRQEYLDQLALQEEHEREIERIESKTALSVEKRNYLIQKEDLRYQEKKLELLAKYGKKSDEWLDNEKKKLQDNLKAFLDSYNARVEAYVSSVYGPDWRDKDNVAAFKDYNAMVANQARIAQGQSRWEESILNDKKVTEENIKRLKEEKATQTAKDAEAAEYLNEELEKENHRLTIIKKQMELLGLHEKDKSRGSYTNNGIYSDRIKLLQDMLQKYKQAAKEAYGFAKAEEKTGESFEDAWKTIMPEGYGDLEVPTSYSALAGMLQRLEEFTPKVDKNGNLSKYLSELKKAIADALANVDIEMSVRIREDFGRQMEEAISGYELTLELQKLNLPSDILSDLFNVESVDLSDLRRRVTTFYNELASEGNIDRDDMKSIEGYIKKIDGMESKQQRERIKDYAKYLEYELSERAKISMEYARKIAEVQMEIFSSDEDENQKRREKIIRGLTKERDEKLAKQDWEDFKNMDVYVQMMEDLEKHGTVALRTMREELEQIRKNANNLSPRALKEVISAIEKIREIEINRTDPFKGIAISKKNVQDALKDAGVSSKSELYASADAVEKELVSVQAEKREVDRIVAAKQKQKDLQKEITKLSEKEEIKNIIGGSKTDDEKIQSLNELIVKKQKEAADIAKERENLEREITKLSREQSRLTVEYDSEGVTEERKAEIKTRQDEIASRIKEITELIDTKAIGENIAKGIVDAAMRYVQASGLLSGLNQNDLNDQRGEKEQKELSEKEKELQQIQEKYQNAITAIDTYNKQVARLMLFIDEWTSKIQGLWSEISNLSSAYEGEFGEWVSRWGKVVDTSLQQVSKLSKAFSEFQQTRSNYLKSAQKKAADKASNALDSIGKANDNVQIQANTAVTDANTIATNTNTVAKQANATANSSVGATAAAATPAVATFGTTLLMAMGWVGLIIAALEALFAIIKAVAGAHDDSLQEEIEEHQKKIDDLKDAYERLEKQIEKTWTVMDYMNTYEQQIENIKQQIEALEAQRRAENEKKNTDDDKMREYSNAIQDAYDELDELAQKQIEVFGGLGEVNYRSAAEEFVSAWKDAFLETGDGLEALQEHFDEFLQEWFVKQATMRIAGAMLERTFRMIDESVNESSEGGVAVTMAELQAIRDEFATQAPLISEALEELAGMWDLGNGEGSLSGLAAGIQGMTEEQANILEAYWNSVRMYTANIDGNVERIANILGAGGSATNPQLQQLQIIAQHTQAIHTLLDNVTRSGHPQGGLGIKVFNN